MDKLCVLLLTLASLIGSSWSLTNLGRGAFPPPPPPVLPPFNPNSRFRRETKDSQPLVKLEEPYDHHYANAQPTDQLRFRRNYIHPTYQAPAPRPSKPYFY